MHPYSMPKPIATIYLKDVLPKREALFGVTNIHATPKLEKVVISARIKRGGSVDQEKVLSTLSKITGQKAVPTKARLSISNFKIREGQVLGAKVTLRGERARDFLDRLVNITFPRVRDFSGLPGKGFDGHGNYTIGLREHNVFPEAASDDVSSLHGLEVTVGTSAANDADGRALLMSLGFPFKK